MTAKTTTIHLKTTAEETFNFVSNIENLPKWATGFCKALRKEGDQYIVTTPMGDMIQRFDVNAVLGTIDMYAGPTTDQMWCWPARVTSDNMGGSIFAFTCIQMPDQPNEAFEGQCKELAIEFDILRGLLEGEKAAA